MKKKFKSFLNDEDGFSAKDFLMVSFGTVFLLMVVTAFVISLVGVLPSTTLSVIGSLDGVIITIVGGVFGLQGIKEFRSNSQSKLQSDDSSYNEDEPRLP